VKLFDAAAAGAERFREHFSAASGALGQCRTGLLWSALRAVKLGRHLQMRSSKPDPLGADVVHVREDGGNGAGLAGRFSVPGTRVEMFDKHLVHALIGGKDMDCGSAELSVRVELTGLTGGQGCFLPEPSYFRAWISGASCESVRIRELPLGTLDENVWLVENSRMNKPAALI
jgi:hypothetical protein